MEVTNTFLYTLATRYIYYILLVSLGILSACSNVQKVVSSKSEPPSFGPQAIKLRILDSETKYQRFIGFALYDQQLDSMVVAHNADKYFVPASNTKLFTFYASLKMLGDSIPALKYFVTGDSLLFWGTGDPSFLHMDLKNVTAYEFLKNRKEKLYYITAPFASTAFAPNWSWDDYNYYYQPERSIFPIYGNVVKFTNKAKPYSITPTTFKSNVSVVAGQQTSQTAILRDWRTNNFTYFPKSAAPDFSMEVPFITSAELTVKLLADTLKRPVKLVKRTVPKGGKVLLGLPADSVYKRMLQVSDNLFAEQLMVLSSGTKSDTLSVEKGIQFALKTYLADLPDAPVWVDGSGLSTINLCTPRTIIALLQKLQNERSHNRLLPLLATGGRPGTFRNIYKAPVPFVFGKSGTLAHVHNHSGYLLTKSGKTLLFSFMNNNYKVASSVIRDEMERIITEIHEKY